MALRPRDQLRHHPLRGPLFESWVVSEIYKARTHRGLPSSLFHFREARGPEVDLLVEEADRLIVTEIKSGATVAADWFDHLLALEERVRRSLPHLEVESRLVYGGEQSQRRSGVDVLSWRDIPSTSWGGG